MKVYLVGGAVRDQLLGISPRERDWVVIGETPSSMEKAGFRKIGRDFPVFLHPETREEYALARTERKTGKGYLGFECDANPNVTLLEDLQRRDLTINAMALGDEGELIDPFFGKKDLEARLLRHVSPAFIEDPVRVLRIAGFLARYHHLGFSIANETRMLMYDMVKRGELAHLVPERVWQEFSRALSYKNPEYFIKALRASGALAVIFPEIDGLFGVPNPPKYHPEIDSGIHSLKALEWGVVISEKPHVRFGALVHDLGKVKTEPADWPSHHGHDETGCDIISAFSKRLKIPSVFSEFAILVSRFHLTIHRISELTPSTIVKVFEKTNAFRNPDLFYDLLDVCETDAAGCSFQFERSQYWQRGIWEKLLLLCSEVDTKPFLEKGLEGEKIKAAIHETRVERVKTWRQDEKQ